MVEPIDRYIMTARRYIVILQYYNIHALYSSCTRLEWLGAAAKGDRDGKKKLIVW